MCKTYIIIFMHAIIKCNRLNDLYFFFIQGNSFLSNLPIVNKIKRTNIIIIIKINLFDIYEKAYYMKYY